jgi:hypothetical protein
MIGKGFVPAVDVLKEVDQLMEQAWHVDRVRISKEDLVGFLVVERRDTVKGTVFFGGRD